MHLRSLYRDSFMGNQAGNSSVGYLVLAVMVGLAGISSLTAFGNATDLAIANKAASTSTALPAVGGDANAAVSEQFKMEADTSEAAQVASSATTEAPATDVGTASYGARTHHGSNVWGGVSKLALGVASAFAVKYLVTAGLGGVAAALAAPAIGALGMTTAILGLDAWHDIHPGSFHAVTNWIDNSFIGSAVRWVKDSFIGDAFRWVTGDHLIGNTLTGVVGGAWNAFSAAVTGAVGTAMGVGETVLNAAKTVGMFVYDKTQLDRLFGDEFSDYRGLWRYPVASMFWSGAFDAAEDSWRYLKRIGRFNRPDVAKQVGKLAGKADDAKESPATGDDSWPFAMQVGDRTSDLESVLAEIGIDPTQADFDGAVNMIFENEKGEQDVLGVYITGNDTEGYRVDAVVQRAGAEEPESVFAYQMTADELKEYGDNIAFAAAEQAGLDFNGFKETLMQQTYDQVEPGKSQAFAQLSMDGSDIIIQGAQVNLEKFENNTVPMTSSFWRFSMVDEPMTEQSSDDGYVDAVFELVEAEANTSVIEVAPPETSNNQPQQQSPNATSSASNVPR